MFLTPREKALQNAQAQGAADYYKHQNTPPSWVSEDPGFIIAWEAGYNQSKKFEQLGE